MNLDCTPRNPRVTVHPPARQQSGMVSRAAQPERVAAITRRLVPCLLSGVVLTLASAWIPSAFFPMPTVSTQSQDDATLARFVPAEWGNAVISTRWSSLGVHWWTGSWTLIGRPGSTRLRALSRESSPAGAAPQDERLVILNISGTASGWPLPCMYWQDPAPPLGAPPGFETALTEQSLMRSGVISRPLCTWTDRRGLVHGLPRSPLSTGFLVNTAIYSTMLALLMTVVQRWKSRRRLRSGRCLACGYDVMCLHRCPECGATNAAVG